MERNGTDRWTDGQGSVLSLPSVSSSSSSSSRRHLGQPCAVSVCSPVRPSVKEKTQRSSCGGGGDDSGGAVERRRRELHTAQAHITPTDRKLDLRWREERKKEGKEKSGGGGRVLALETVLLVRRTDWRGCISLRIRLSRSPLFMLQIEFKPYIQLCVYSQLI